MDSLLIVFITSFFVVLLSTPSLIKVAILKRLLDEPGGRKTHHRMIPTIGGIIIFAATIFSFALWFPCEKFFNTAGIGNTISDLKYIAEVNHAENSMSDFKYILATMIILFFVGVKDDIIGTAAIKKLAAHILVGLILVLMANVRLTGLHGLFGILEIPFWASVFLSLFTIIVIINAFNLIDGVDGLAGGVGFIVSVSLGLWFHFAGDKVMSILAFSLAGSLLAFLIFNFSPAKIFMGDSGSLTIGLIISILAIRAVEYTKSTQSDYQIIYDMSKPVFVMAVLAYPLVDTLRIFIYRTVRGISPFSADRNHIHHQLKDYGFSDRKTVIIIYTANLLIIGLAVLLRKMDTSLQFLIIGSVVFVLANLPYLMLRKRRSMRVVKDDDEEKLDGKLKTAKA
ncbi:MAG: MraY family glycosyltransferase [Bacteroidota bacterium]